ncbi:hypothetical protein QT381_08685 [Galbitalea sp. SE-J8]|uniref:hypothetical protein n=1 Tax=Galbitalea sp. SE-J8 TaxID=3054952 RepID=UPI00259CE6F4|nr:hypothetical protein [Galbitalea sp. SE-J8]MDM4763082.1 hypothetical protein [Galbitalea sp. SE-J8]
MTVVTTGQLVAALDSGAGAPGGELLVDATEDRSSSALLAGLKALAEIGRTGRRTVAVVGPVAGADWEEHDRIGRIVVRLDIRSLVAVGDATRHLSTAAGLEGSWDGEAVLVADEAAAYDEVRAGLLRADSMGDDVVLVTVPAVLERLAIRAVTR